MDTLDTAYDFAYRTEAEDSGSSVEITPRRERREPAYRVEAIMDGRGVLEAVFGA